MNQKYNILSVSLVLMLLSACSQHSLSTHPQVASDVKVTTGANRQSIAPGTSSAAEINAAVTLNKSEILGKEFLYGADLQYSSIYDKDYDLYTQSQALGHIPAYFRKNGGELQLLADNRRLFPSDVNHPDQLISRFTIISETADTMTVSEGNASAFLISMIDSKAHIAKDHWARSFEFVSKGNYLLQETTVVLQDGTVAEMMESIMPKEAMAISNTFEKFQLDPEDAVGATEGPAARYRLLSGEAIFNGEEKLSFAQHYDINDAATGAAKTIDWYVTPNIKDEHLPVVKQAVEGWNRYFRKFAGIKRDVVLFKGKVPAGVKIGDPRYNVINWDSRLVAGAAYESQATDPFTGKQSHSLIYMPVAWFQIGMDYWINGKYSDEKAAVSPKNLAKNSKFKLSCARDLTGIAAAINSGRMSKKEAEDFSIQLMKQTLFHEVGHALGLAHNFKGSLSFDRKDPKSMFSTSIMDYNDYEIERAAFTSPETEDGPELEYDRQALSAIYNKMADVNAANAVLPACNDAEADTEGSGSVDPLCIRYDIEKDPTLSVETAFNRVNLAQLAGDVTLIQALDNVSKEVLSADALKKVTNAEEANALATKYSNALKGVMNFYFLGGKASVLKTVRTNVKSLYLFSDDLPPGYVEAEMRERAFKGVQNALAMKTLPVSVRKKLVQLSVASTAAIAKTGFGAGIEADSVIKMAIGFERDGSKGLLKLRVGVISSLGRVETLPLYFGNSKDYEAGIITSLAEVVTLESNHPLERVMAARALMTYKGRPGVDTLLKKAKEAAKLALAKATDNGSREFALALDAALSE